MTFEQIRLAVETRMSDWLDAPVAYDNVPAGPAVKDAQDNKNPWVRLTIAHGDSATASVGSSPKVRRTGTVICQVFTAQDRGSKAASDIADSLAAHLEYYQDGGFLMRAASVNRIGPQNNWYQYNVSLPFVAD